MYTYSRDDSVVINGVAHPAAVFHPDSSGSFLPHIVYLISDEDKMRYHVEWSTRSFVDLVRNTASNEEFIAAATQPAREVAQQLELAIPEQEQIEVSEFMFVQ